jgi:acetyltransferase-like isoleucine patch superfamily enzyme/coenzyme F420-reducing hydrogenase beta subunit
MIDIKEKKNCCGCNACGDICSRQAIDFKVDFEGFWYPEIDPQKCIHCGLCEKVCPIINAKERKKNDLEQPICYAAEHKNLEVIFDSTSGGLFTALAEKMYTDSGYVGGAIFNDDFSVRHYISNNEGDLLKIRNTKYLQSDLSGFYRNVRKLLDKGEKVLVCGCPCQMVALRCFLSKEYVNLVVIDLICLGVNSPKVWHKYLGSFQEKYDSPVVYTKSKSKELGWHNLTQKLVLANGKICYETKNDCSFIIGYVKNHAYCRPSCYDCSFKNLPHLSDITLADYWGIEKLNTSLDKDLGTSLVLVNSKKGQAYFDFIKQKINCIQTPFKSMISVNSSITKSLSMPSINRKQFFEDLDIMSFAQIAHKYFTEKETYKTKLKRFIRIARIILKDTNLHIHPLFRVLRYNRCLTSLWHKKAFIPSHYCVLDISKNASFIVNDIFRLGIQRIKKSKLESRLYIEDNATLEVNGWVTISYGADIEIFKNAKLTFGGDTWCNINLTIICMERIDIGKYVTIGRDVSIRDTNGDHYISRENYQTYRPVVIKEKAWLASGCTIMPGVTIGEGAIVGANAVVVKDVPPHTIVAGNPARVIRENVLFKA